MVKVKRVNGLTEDVNISRLNISIDRRVDMEVEEPTLPSPSDFIGKPIMRDGVKIGTVESAKADFSSDKKGVIKIVGSIYSKEEFEKLINVKSNYSIGTRGKENEG